MRPLLHPESLEPRSGQRFGSRRVWIGSGVGLALAVFAPAVVCAFAGLDEPGGLWIVRLLSVAALAFVGVLGLVLAPFRGDVGERLFLFGGLGIAASFALAFGVRLAEDVALRSCVARGEPLVAAIERYARDRGGPPAALSALVPDYLPAVPGTGLPRAPAFVYERAPESGPGGAAIPWELRVEWLEPIFTTCVLYCRPDVPGSELYFGRPARRIGGWYHVAYD